MDDERDRHRVRREWVLFIVAIGGLGLGILNFVRDSPPGPPVLSAEWTTTESDYVAWVPPITGTNHGTDNEWTKAFPIPITVSNFGDLTARDVELTITHPPNLGLQSDQFDVTYQRVKGGTEPLVQTRISLGDLDPGESTPSLTSLFAVTENTIDMAIDAETKDGVAITVGTSVSFVMLLRVQITAEDTPFISQTLSLGIGTVESFRESGEEFCQIKRDEVICGTLSGGPAGSIEPGE